MIGWLYSKEWKALLFTRVDKGGTVRGPEKSTGVGGAVPYTWLRKSGLSMHRNIPRSLCGS